MKKYEATKRNGSIKLVDCERETKASVWIDNKRINKVSDYVCYFDTLDEAKAYLIEITESEIQLAKLNLDRKEKHLEYIKGISWKSYVSDPNIFIGKDTRAQA